MGFGPFRRGDGLAPVTVEKRRTIVVLGAYIDGVMTSNLALYLLVGSPVLVRSGNLVAGTTD